MLLESALYMLAGAGAAIALVPAARAMAPAVGMLAIPTADRWHRRPVGKLGGVAMAVAFFAVAPWTGVGEWFWPLLLTTALMVGLGLVDDVRSIRPASKLLGQLLITALLLYLLPPIALTGQIIVDQALAFFWVVGLTNAFNLIDNIDGLAAGVAAIAATFLAVALVGSGVPALGPLALALFVCAGVGVGFLVFNFHPASIFMGDSGSHLLGFFVSGAALVALPHLDGLAFWPALGGPVVTLLIPIFDTAFVTITRGLSGRGVFQGGRDHTSHRLVALGLGERQVVLGLYGLAVAGGVIGLAFHAESRYAWGVAVLYVAVLAALGIYLGHLDASNPGSAGKTPLLPSDLTTRHRAYEVALDALVIGVAYYLAFGLRFAEPEFSHFLPYFTESLPLVLATQLGGLAMAGTYQQVWRSFGVEQALSLLRGIGLGAIGTLIAVLFIYRFEGFSRAVFLFDAALLTVLLISLRATLSAVDDGLRRRTAPGRRALILGAGRGGALAVREVLQNPTLAMVPMGFLDDDPAKWRTSVDGIRVLGPLSDLPGIVSAGADEAPAVVIVAISDLPSSTFADICDVCDAHGVVVHRLRFAFEQTDWRDRSGRIVRFPER